MSTVPVLSEATLEALRGERRQHTVDQRVPYLTPKAKVPRWVRSVAADERSRTCSSEAATQTAKDRHGCHLTLTAGADRFRRSTNSSLMTRV